VKIIFLDIDGVLNTWNPNDFNLHKDKIELLNQLIDKTNAKVVLSSDWRKKSSLEQINNKLKLNGFKHNLFDQTPVLESRKNEIILYLFMLKENPESIVILDDIPADDFGDLLPYVVNTHSMVGLTQKNCELAELILKMIKYES